MKRDEPHLDALALARYLTKGDAGNGEELRLFVRHIVSGCPECLTALRELSELDAGESDPGGTPERLDTDRLFEDALARSGALDRLTALALIPLGLWFCAAVIAMTGADYSAVAAWASSPLVAGLLILLLVATFYHAALGLQVVIEDYVHHEMTKLLLVLAVKAACLLLALTAVLSVLILLFARV